MRPDSNTVPRVRAWLPWVVLGVVVVVVVGWVAWPSGAKSDPERARSLAAELRCPDCESLSAADSQTQSARAIRRGTLMPGDSLSGRSRLGQ